VNKPPVVRNANLQDMPELRRLFYAMMAEAGVDEFNIGKVQKKFERGIKRDGGILLVATGKPGRLVGFILFELIAPWFTEAERITEVCIFVEPGHRRSVGARELRKVAGWWRKESDKRKTDAAPAVANSLSAAQNGAATTPTQPQSGLTATPQPSSPCPDSPLADTQAPPTLIASGAPADSALQAGQGG
jgi:hypothetical protein